MKVDIYSYAGAISPAGYAKICAQISSSKRADSALLIMGTPGGDPHAGFRIARALQHTYEEGFSALIPRYCKSAGTLVLLGAKKLYMADQSELGPLDIQIKKGDELYGRNSGLDMNQAVDFLKAESLASFNQFMERFVRQGLSTKFAAEIAVKLVNGIFNPIAAQIDPLRLAEMQRATAITLSYGQLLSETGKNVQPSGLGTLVGGYPSHGFVIDRKEARSIFNEVDPPTAIFKKLCDTFQKLHASKVNDQTPTITRETIEIDDGSQGVKHGSDNFTPKTAATSAATSESHVNGASNPSRRGTTTRQRGTGKKPAANG